MDRGDFRKWKDYLSEKYTIAKKDQEGKPLRIREIQWMNFGWGEDGDGLMVYHPDEVWFRNSFSIDEPWKKVEITTSAQVDSQPSILYESPLLLNPNKVKDLQKMARKHIAEPERDFYMSLKSSAAIQDSDDDE